MVSAVRVSSLFVVVLGACDSEEVLTVAQMGHYPARATPFILFMK